MAFTPKIPAVRKSDRGAERKPRAERWVEILDAAAKCFFEKGYDAASLQDIADRVGILKGSIYYYIKTKPDLRDALLLEVHNEGLARIKALAETPGNALDKLEAMIRGHVRYIAQNLEKTTVYLMELKSVAKKGGLFDKQEYRDVFRDVIREGQNEGTLLSDLDPGLTAQAMLGAVNSLYQWYRPRRERPVEPILEHFVTVLLRGHASDAALKELLGITPR